GGAPADREPPGEGGTAARGRGAPPGDGRRPTRRAWSCPWRTPGRNPLLASFGRFGRRVALDFRAFATGLAGAEDPPFLQRPAQHFRRGFVGRRQLLEVVGAERDHRRVEVLALLLKTCHVAGEDRFLALRQSTEL